MRQMMLSLTLFSLGCGGTISTSTSDANTLEADVSVDDANSDLIVSSDVTTDLRSDGISDVTFDAPIDTYPGDTLECCPLYTGSGGDCNTIGGSHAPGTPCPETCHGPIIGLKRGTIYCYDIAGCPISVPLVSCVRYVDAGPEGGD